MYTIISDKLGIKVEDSSSLQRLDKKKKKFDGNKFIKAALKAKVVLEKEEKQLKEEYEKRHIFNSNFR